MYDVSGNEVPVRYDVGGNVVTSLYDVQGNPIASESDLVVMSYNVQKQGGINGSHIQRAIIEKYKPDIMGMQEYRTSYEEAGYYQEYPYTVNNSSVLQNYDGILSKYELKDAGGALFQVRYVDPCGYVFGTISYQDKEIYVLNIHLSPYGDDYSVYRAPEIQEVLELIREKEYFIITGDFNALTVQNETDPEYEAIYKPFVDMGCHLANCCEEFGFQDTYTSSPTVENARWLKLDNIITSPNIDIVNAVVDKTKLDYLNGSWEIDHFPVIAYLEVKS